MKKFVTLLSFLLITCMYAQAQVASGIRPEAGGKIGEYSEWKKVDVTWDDGAAATIEYRIRLANRKGIACHYDLEVKNTSELKLTVRAKSSYYDKLVKSNFGDESKETLKPGKGVEIRFIAQGCKKEKGTDADDFGVCLACDFGIDLHVSK